MIAFEGLDQSGKETQARLLRARLEEAGHRVESLTFPDDTTTIGQEIRAGLSTRSYPADVMQLLYIANRHERKEAMEEWLASGVVVICDRYLASSVAYGEAHGLSADWLIDTQRFLPQPALTILLDIAPETARARKAAGRDKYESDLDLLARVRDSYRGLAKRLPNWVMFDGERSRDDVQDGDQRDGRVTTRAAVIARTSFTPAFLQHARARFNRRARRAHIIDDQHARTTKGMRNALAQLERITHVLVPARRWQLGLHRRMFHAAQRVQQARAFRRSSSLTPNPSP